MATPSPRLIPVLFACLLATSCDSAATLSWEIVFADATLADRAVLVEGRILRDGCGGAELFRSTATRDRGPEMPPVLDAGTYGFAGRASDTDCVWFAAGCIEITLPDDGGGTLSVTLEADTESAACPPAECMAGVCEGAMDAGVDSGPVDAAVDAPPIVDAGCGGACGECEMCVSGTCAPATDGASCGGGSCLAGACCTGCTMGGACVAGTDPTACGSGGGACATCACPVDSCGAGACVASRTVDAFAVAETTVCALSSGALFCWGNNSMGQLALGTSGAGTEELSPIAAATSLTFDGVASGDDHLLAVSSGSLYSWGENMDGNLGHGDLVTRSSITRVGTETTWISAEGAMSGDVSCALEGRNTLRCAGQNDYGQIGLGDLVDHLVFDPLPGAWALYGMGHYHNCGVQTDGSLHCWGRNRSGQLGLGDRGVGTERTTPTRVGVGTDWTAIAGGEYFTCGLRGTGQLWCWGSNLHGQLALGDTTARSTPTRVGSDTDWDLLGPGDDHACAIKLDGTLWCWGQNDAGQLGGGSAGTDALVPRQVGTDANWAVVFSGLDYSCASNDAGHLFCWGQNDLGQLGQGDRAQRVDPTPVCW